MNILFVCDQYPPFDRGGYAQLCFDLAHELRKMGNSITILCEEIEAPLNQIESEPVIRKLRIPNKYNESIPIPVQQVLFAPSRRAHNEAYLRKVAQETGAEAIIFWPNLYGDPHLWLSALDLPNVLIAFYVAGVSPHFSVVGQYWSFPGKKSFIRIFKSIARPFMTVEIDEHIQEQARHVMSVSIYERNRMIDEGIPADEIVVIRNGIDLDQFQFRGFHLPSPYQDRLRVIYAGRLVKEKGVHTVLEALAILKRDYPNSPRIDLTVLGTGAAEYQIKLEHLALDLGISESIDFHGWIPREEIPSFLGKFNVLVLPTIHPEPLARVIHEAMAVGLVVVATPTGGTPELVHNDKTGVLFSPENPQSLAECFLRLSGDPHLCNQLVNNARDLVKKELTLQKMAESVIASLEHWQQGNTHKILSNGPK